MTAALPVHTVFVVGRGAFDMAKTEGFEAESSRQAMDLQDEADRLRREHCEIKARLVAFNDRLYLSPEEEFEKKTLQKLKLAKKDRLACLMGEVYSTKFR